MTRADLVDYLFNNAETLLTKKQAEEAVTLVFDGVHECLRASGEVKIRHFGTFALVRHKAKRARDIKKGTMITIPERTVVKFKPASLLADAVK